MAHLHADPGVFAQGPNLPLAFLTSQHTSILCTSTFRIEDHKYFKHEVYVLCILIAMQNNITYMSRERQKKA